MMDTDEPLVLEDKDDAKGPPPNKSYPVPKHLLPQLSTFIEELLEKKFIEPVPHGRGARAWYSPILILIDTYPQRTDKAGPILHATNT